MPEPLFQQDERGDCAVYAIDTQDGALLEDCAAVLRGDVAAAVLFVLKNDTWRVTFSELYSKTTVLGALERMKYALLLDGDAAPSATMLRLSEPE